MLLSESIRLGAMYGPQLRGILTDGTGASCAIGASMLAVGMKPLEFGGGWTFIDKHTLADKFPSLDNDYRCDEREFESTVWDHIVYLNNVKGRTREQIADWLVESGNDCEAVLPEAVDQAENPVEVAA